MILVLVIAVIVIAVFSFFISEGFKYTRMIARIFMGLVYEPDSPQQFETHGKAIQIFDSSGKSVNALFQEVAGSKKIVIFCHESGSGKESWIRYAGFIPSSGISVLSFDFDMETLSQWPTQEHVNRLKTVMQWAKQYGGSETQIVLFGVSNGADIALQVAESDACVNALIADGLYSMKEIFRDYIRKWAPVLVKPNFFGEHYPDWVVHLFTELGFSFSQKKAKTRFVETESLLKKRKKPLCMIYGSEDNYVLPTHQKLMLDLGARNKGFESLVIAKAGHNQAVKLDQNAYENKIKEFLNKI